MTRAWKGRYSPEPLNPSGGLRDTIREEFVNSFQDQSILGSAVPGSLPFGTEIRPLVTDLPTSPSDGDEIRYLADATSGVIWQLRYRASAPSAYRWEFLGGPPLIAQTDPSPAESTASTSYTNLTTTGPSITLALAGEYLISARVNGSNATANVIQYMSYAVGATAASDTDAAYSISVTSIGTVYAEQTRLKTVAAGDVILAKYKTGSSTGTFERRSLTITPVRVGRV